MSINELELIKQAKAGNTFAANDICTMYKSLVVSIARRYYLVGGDTEDLISEGMSGLFKAIISFDCTKNDNFKAYASTLIIREIIGAIRRNNTEKAKVSSDMLFYDDEDGIQIAIDELNPEDDFLQNEKVVELRAKINARLSPLEIKVLDLYLDSYNYHDIARKLNKQDKCIDNALNRIKNKARQVLKGE
jgi:RNA polymerase sporulation-specific sigma factor